MCKHGGKFVEPRNRRMCLLWKVGSYAWVRQAGNETKKRHKKRGNFWRRPPFNCRKRGLHWRKLIAATVKFRLGHDGTSQIFSWGRKGAGKGNCPLGRGDVSGRHWDPAPLLPQTKGTACPKAVMHSKKGMGTGVEAAARIMSYREVPGSMGSSKKKFGAGRGGVRGGTTWTFRGGGFRRGEVGGHPHRSAASLQGW